MWIIALILIGVGIWLIGHPGWAIPAFILAFALSIKSVIKELLRK